jgi:branched-chain amino acid aminotransferase
MGIFFSYNGKFFKAGKPVISVDSRALKFGDGLFETMKMVNGKLELAAYHFERLFNGMKMLAFDIPSDFTPAFFAKEISALIKKNNDHKAARIRLMIFRGDGTLNLNNHLPNYIIQTWEFKNTLELNSTGLVIDVYPHVKKAIDILSNSKTNNFLPYALGAIHAQKNNLDDCILLNTMGKICDTTIANIFIIRNKIIYTPSLKEGCIAGVMRRWIIEKINYDGIKVKEKSLTIEDVKKADEMFVTNSLYPMRWVKQFQNIWYTNKQIKTLYPSLIKRLNS